MENIWKSIDLSSDIKSPAQIVEDIFRPLPEATKNKVGFKLQKVNYFPEEVRYSGGIATSSSFAMSLASAGLLPTPEPHPEFGYDPYESKSQQTLRYRLILHPFEKEDYKFELFKFKFPVLFYPVLFYIDKDDFPALRKEFKEDRLNAKNEIHLRTIVSNIATSEATINLIKRLRVLS